MARYDFDMITIGAGSGGVASSRRAGSYGARVAIVEESRIGGTCVLRGCVPKKLLVYGAQFADAFEDAAGFGWSVAPPKFDWPALIAAKNNELDRLEKIYVNMLRNSAVEIIEGRGVLVDPHTVEVAGRHYTAGEHPDRDRRASDRARHPRHRARDLVERGARPAELPRRIVIVGGGYIAVEFAGIFRGFGCEVAEIIRREELLYGFDDDLRVALAQEMRNRGVEIHTRTNVHAHRKGPARGLQRVTTIGQEISADLVMYATGRGPNTKGSGLGRDRH
jgi:glutathione reductase (NADPH)